MQCVKTLTINREKEIRMACDVARGPFLVYCRELLEEIDRMRAAIYGSTEDQSCPQSDKDA